MLKNIFNKFFGKEELAKEAAETVESEELETEQVVEPSLLERIPDGEVICSMKDADKYFKTQKEFAAAMGVAQSLLSGWQSGNLKISSKAAKRVLLKTQGKIDLFKFPEYSG